MTAPAIRADEPASQTAATTTQASTTTIPSGAYRMATVDTSISKQSVRIVLQRRGDAITGALVLFMGTDSAGRPCPASWSMTCGVREKPVNHDALRWDDAGIRGDLVLASERLKTTLGFNLTIANGRLSGTITGAGPANGVIADEAAMAAANGLPSGPQWPAWRGPDGSGSPTFSTVRIVDDLRQARLAWYSEDRIPGAVGAGGDYPWGFSIFNSAVVADGKVFFNSAYRNGEEIGEPVTREGSATGAKQPIRADETVLCIDAASGRTLWKTVLPGAGLNLQGKKHLMMGGTGCAAGGRYYAVTSYLGLLCLDGASGKIIWESGFEPGPTRMREALAAAIAAKQLVKPINEYPILASAGGVIFCQHPPVNEGWRFKNPVFDAETGKVLWQMPGSRARRVVIDGAERILCIAGDKVLCLEPRTGKALWTSTGFSASLTEDQQIGDVLIGTTGAWPRGVYRSEMPDARFVAWKITAQGLTKLWEAPMGFALKNGHLGTGGAGDRFFYRSGDYAQDQTSPNKVWNGQSYIAALDLATGKEVARGDCLHTHWATITMRVGDRVLSCGDPTHAQQTFIMLDAGTLKPLGWNEKANGPWTWEHWNGSGRLYWGPHPQTSGYDLPLDCPVVDGRIFFRGRDRIWCYDLRQPDAK